MVVAVRPKAHSVVWSPSRDWLSPLYLVDLTKERPRLEVLTETGISPAWSRSGEAVYYFGDGPDIGPFDPRFLSRRDLETGATAVVDKETRGLLFVHRDYGVTKNPCAR